MQSCCKGYLTSIKKNGEYGCRFPVSADACYIGRDSNCDICIKEANVKERHCLVKTTYNKVTIYNLCSEHPVLVNNSPVGAEGRSLNHYDKITITDTTFEWENAAENLKQKYSLPVGIKEVINADFAQRYSDPNFQSLANEETINEMKAMGNTLLHNYDASDSIMNATKRVETVITPENSPRKINTYSSDARKLTASCPRNLSLSNEEKQTCLSNSCSKDIRFVRRSRLFGKTHKATKSTFDSPEKGKIAATSARTYFAKIVTPLQENRTPSKEVKSRFESKRNSFRKSVTRLSFNVSGNVVDNLNESGPETLSNGNMQSMYSNNVDNKTKDINQKEDTTKENMTSVLNNTFETTVANETTANQSVLPTPKCFTNTHHSTPKYIVGDQPGTPSKFSMKTSESNVISASFDTAPMCPNRSNETTLPYRSLSTSPVVSTNRVFSHFSDDTLRGDNESHQTFCKIKSRKTDSSVEVRRNTRNRSNILKRTLEECNEDSLTSNELNQTTPEKCIGESVSTRNVTSEETDFESCSPEKNLDRKFGFESEKTPFECGVHECSSEKKDRLSATENVEKSHRPEDSLSRTDVARCTRNLSYISPPENNKSQEFMDSVVSTPKKTSSFKDGEAIAASPASKLNTPANDESMPADNSVCCTPKSPASSFRNRRSTGFVPFVGTPSEVYRTNKGILTPAIKSRFHRTSMDVEANGCARDSFSAVFKSKQLQRQQSCERKSTPLKADKSSIRDSLQLHSPIIEDYSLEFEEESQNESNNESKFKFVSKRRRRMCKSSFAMENRIMEESEGTDDNDEVEDSLMPLESFDVEDSAFESARIVVNRSGCDDATNVDNENVSNRTFSIDSGDESESLDDAEKNSPIKSTPIVKSILTPLPRPSMTREKSVKKVTFIGIGDADSETNNESSLYSPSDTIPDMDSVVSAASENESYAEEESGVDPLDDDALFISDKLSIQSSSLMADLPEKSNSSDAGFKNVVSKSPCLLGIRSLLTSPKSPNCNYLEVSGVEQLMKTPPETVATETFPKSTSMLSCDDSQSKVFSVPGERCSQKSDQPSLHESNSNSLAQEPSSDSMSKSTLQPPKAQSILELGEHDENLIDAPEIEVKRVEPESVTPGRKPVSSPPESEQPKAAPMNDSVFRTPTMRRCSKHFRIHRSSMCQATFNTSENPLEDVEPSVHDCSASLDNSLVESTKCESADPSRSPKSNFQDVLVELKSKLEDLHQKSETSAIALKRLDENADLYAATNVESAKLSSPTGVTEDSLADEATEPNVPYAIRSVPQILITAASTNTTVTDTSGAHEEEEKSVPPKDTEYSAITNDTFKTCSLVSNSTTIVESKISSVCNSHEGETDNRVGDLEMKCNVLSEQQKPDMFECGSRSPKTKDDSFHKEETTSAHVSCPILDLQTKDVREDSKVPASISSTVLQSWTNEDKVQVQEEVSTLFISPNSLVESDVHHLSSPASCAEPTESDDNEEPKNTVVACLDEEESVSENVELIQKSITVDVSNSLECASVSTDHVNHKTIEKCSDPAEELSSLLKETQSLHSTVIASSEETLDLTSNTEVENTVSDSSSRNSPERSRNGIDDWSGPSEGGSSKLITAEQSPLASSTKIGTSELGVTHFHSPAATPTVTWEYQKKLDELVLVSSAPVSQPVENGSPAHALPILISIDPPTFYSKSSVGIRTTKESPIFAVERNAVPEHVLESKDKIRNPVTIERKVNVSEDVVTCAEVTSSETNTAEVTSSQLETVANECLTEESSPVEAPDNMILTETSVDEPEVSKKATAEESDELENVIPAEMSKLAPEKETAISERSVAAENVKETPINEIAGAVPESNRFTGSLSGEKNETVEKMAEKGSCVEVKDADAVKTIDNEATNLSREATEIVSLVRVAETRPAEMVSTSVSTYGFEIANSLQNSENDTPMSRLSVIIEELPQLPSLTTSLAKTKRIARKDMKKAEISANAENNAVQSKQSTLNLPTRERRTRSALFVKKCYLCSSCTATTYRSGVRCSYSLSTRNNPEPSLPKNTKNKKKSETPKTTNIRVNIPRIGLPERIRDIKTNINETPESQNMSDTELKKKRVTRVKQIATVAAAAGSTRKLRSASVKPAENSRAGENEKSSEQLVNRCSIVLPLLPNVPKNAEATKRTNVKLKTKEDQGELQVKPVKLKRDNRKQKVTFSAEEISQMLNDSSDKENAIEPTNRGRRTQAKKHENISNESVEPRTRRNRKIESSEDQVLIDASCKKATEKTNKITKSAVTKNNVEMSVENVQNGRRTTRSAKNATKDEKEISEVVESKKGTKVGARVLLEVVRVEEIKTNAKNPSKRGNKIMPEEKTPVAGKTRPSKRQKPAVEEEAPVSRSRTAQKEVLPMTENTYNIRASRSKDQKSALLEKSIKSRSKTIAKLSVNIARADVPKTKAKKRIAVEPDDEDTRKRRRISEEESSVSNGKATRAKKLAKEVKRITKRRKETSKKITKMTDITISSDKDMSTKLQASSSASTLGEVRSSKSSTENKKAKKINVSTPRITRSQKRQTSSSRSLNTKK